MANRGNVWPVESRTKNLRRVTKAATKTTFCRRRKRQKNGKKCRRPTVNEQMFDCDGRKRNEHYSYYVNFLKPQKPWDCVVRRQRKLFIWEGEKNHWTNDETVNSCHSCSPVKYCRPIILTRKTICSEYQQKTCDNFILNESTVLSTILYATCKSVIVKKLRKQE